MRRDLDLFKPWSQPTRWNQKGSDIFTLFGDLFNQSDFGRGLSPAVEVDEVEDSYLITVDLPGVKEKDIDVRVDGNQLCIRAERRNERKDERGNRSFSERHYGMFERWFTLPMNSDTEKIECDFDNGVLRVGVPKGEDSRVRKIEISKKGGLIERLLGKTKQDDEDGSNVRRASNL